MIPLGREAAIETPIVDTTILVIIREAPKNGTLDVTTAVAIMTVVGEDIMERTGAAKATIMIRDMIMDMSHPQRVLVTTATIHHQQVIVATIMVTRHPTTRSHTMGNLQGMAIAHGIIPRMGTNGIIQDGRPGIAGIIRQHGHGAIRQIRPIRLARTIRPIPGALTRKV
jgi:hypothetical protein